MSRKKAGLYRIWTDGSFSHAHGVGGAGWVVSYEGTRTEYNHPIKGLDKKDWPHGSEYAELAAVDMALATVPQGSTAIVHTDNKGVAAALKEGKLNAKPERMAAIGVIFACACAHAGRLKSVDYVHVSGENPNLKDAHHQSKIATNAARNLT